MRSVSLVLLLVVVAVASAAPKSDSNKPHYDLKDAPALFEDFIKKYNRHYKDAADRDVHYKAFFESLKKINKLNSNEDGATFGINKFTDYTKEEMDRMNGLKRPTHKPQPAYQVY